MMALEGIRVLDVALQYPGPYCTMLLGDLGAEVLKIERPGTGDPARRWPAFFDSINRNRRSLTVDLKTPEGKEIFYKLAEQYDVITEGFRPGVAQRLLIDFKTIHEVNPRMIYCSISGFGQTGPYRDLPGHDINFQAMAGMLGCFSDPKGIPVHPRLSIADLSSGMFAAIGILAAIVAREKTGIGQFIDCAMLDGLLSWMSVDFGHFFATGARPTDHDAGYGIFRTADGKHLTLGIAHEDLFWMRLCDALGLEELRGLSAAERTQKREELAPQIQSVLATRTRDEWVRILCKADVPVGPVNELEAVICDPHVLARGMIQELSPAPGKTGKQIGFPMKFSKTPAKLRRAAPSLGGHTDEVLSELGYSQREITSLRESAIV